MMADLLHTLLRILAFTTNRAANAAVSPDQTVLSVHFPNAAQAEATFHTFKSAIMEMQGAPFAGMRLDGTSMDFDLAAFLPFEASLRRMLRDMENLYLLSLSVLEPRFAASPVHRMCATRRRERRQLYMSLAFPDTVSHVLLGNWFKVHDFGEDISLGLDEHTSQVRIRISDDLSERLEAAVAAKGLEQLSFYLAMNQGIRMVSSQWHDQRLDTDCLVLEVAGTATDELASGVVTLSDMARFYDYLTVEMGAAAGTDFRYEAVNDEKTAYGVILTWDFAQQLRDYWVNQLYLEYLLSLSPALGYFERFRIERARHHDDRLAHTCYAISSHEPSAVMLAHAFLRKEMGVDVGENYFEENGRYWIEVDEDDLSSNLHFYKSAHLHQHWFAPTLRTMWSIPGISRVRMKKGMLRIRCDQPTFEVLSRLEGAVLPRITVSASSHRGFCHRIYFSPWAVHAHAETLARLAAGDTPPPDRAVSAA